MKDFKPGFRLSKIDVGVLVLGVAAAIWLYPISVLAASIVVFVIGHFFLFCNVFRLSRPPELIWAATYVMLMVLSTTYDILPVQYVFLAQATLTVLLVVLELRKPSYHGSLWKRVNPNLEKWFYDQNVAGR